MYCQETIFASGGDRVCGRPATLVLIYQDQTPLACCDSHALARLRVAAVPVVVVRADARAG